MKPVSLSLQPFAGLLPAAEARVGSSSGLWLLDTGAGITCLDAGLAAREGIEGWGRLVGYRMTGEQVVLTRAEDVAIELAGTTFPHETVGIVNLAEFLPPDLGELAGVLSLSTFAQRPITIDIPARRLILETAASIEERTASMCALTVRCARAMGGLALDLFAGVDAEPGRLFFEIDSCNAGPVILAPTTVEALGLDALAPGEAREDEVPVAGLPPIATPVTTKDILYDGNLGLSVLNDRALTLDLARERAWLSDG